MATRFQNVGGVDNPQDQMESVANGGLALKADGATKYLIANTDQAQPIYWYRGDAQTLNTLNGHSKKENIGIALAPTRVGGGSVPNQVELTFKSGEKLFFLGPYTVSIAVDEL